MQYQLIELLGLHITFDDTEAEHRRRTSEFVSNNVFCTSRDTLSGHVTASAWILSPDRTSTLLTHHRKLGRWLQLGGHVEADHTIQDAAAREAREESGIDDLRLLDHRLFDIDVHSIPARKAEPEHFHYDFRFIFQSMTDLFSVGDESHGLAWVRLSEIEGPDSDASIIRMVRKTAGFLKKLDGA